MANSDYLNDYLQFFQYFGDTLDLSDQLPVKLASYKLLKNEVIGAIFNWTYQYLSDKRCPWHLISFLSRIVIEKTRKRCKKQPVQCGFNPSDNAYEPLKLMHTVIEVINEVCFNYKSSLSVQNSIQNMAVLNPLPPPETVYNVVSVSALKNSRRKMEDRLIVIHDLDTIFTKQDATPSHYYAVFDGHDGEHAAAYCANHLHQYLAESTNFTTDIEQAIRDSFSTTDTMFLNKCKAENIAGGTTAVCALLLPKERTLYVAWVGDSQAALVSQGTILQCVRSHKPDRQDERIRIENEGGMVLLWGVWRVNGQLGVSRAIGDADYKPYVNAVPEIVKIPLSGEEDFFVLGSDGLWDHLPEEDIARVVYEMAYSNPDKAELVSRELIQLAKHNGSCDNISVIVVFLRDPNQIAEGPRWTDRIVSMDTLDNANNPFAIPNKTNADSITPHSDDALLRNITDGLMKNDDMPNNDLIKMLEKSNSERLTPEFDKDDNLGPETDVDNIDEDGSISPNIDSMKLHSESINNNQNLNPFSDIEKSLEINLNLKEGTFEELPTPTDESCPLAPSAVHNVSQLIEAIAESDSEEDEEWNYVSGEEANKENKNPLQLNSEVAELEEEDNMSQLNPNAAEFVPVSPVRAAASPIGRILNDEQVLSQSPKKPPSSEELDLNVPNLVDFDKDIVKKPHETEEAISNGHQSDTAADVNISNSLNNKLDEFHFGPNAAPFTPIKLLDQSEASSTKAVYGDESVLTLETSFDSTFGQEQTDFTKQDPMSMSFHQDRTDDSNPFDLNKVHMLPDDVDEFINRKDDSENSLMNDTLSDLDEHFPLGKPNENKEHNVLVTDLDEDNKNACNVKERLVCSLNKDDKILCPFEENNLDKNRFSPLHDERMNATMNEEKSVFTIEEKELCSPVEGSNEVSPLVENKKFEGLNLDELNTQIVDQLSSAVGGFTFSDDGEKSDQGIAEHALKLIDVGAELCCDHMEISHPNEPVTSEPSPNNGVFLKFENSVCGAEDTSHSDNEPALKLVESAEWCHTESSQMSKPVASELSPNNDEFANFENSISQVEDGKHVEKTGELVLQLLEVAESGCDRLESPQFTEPVASEQSPNNEEFAKFENVKYDNEMAKEKVLETLLDLNSLHTVAPSDEQCMKPSKTTNENVNINTATNVDLLAEIQVDQVSESIKETKEQILTTDVTAPNLNRFCLDENEQIVTTTGTNQLFTNPTEVQSIHDNSVKSIGDTESVATADVGSFLDRSLLVEVESPLSANVSLVSHLEKDQQAVPPSGSDLQLVNHNPDCSIVISSPTRELQILPGMTSTPTAPGASSVSSLASQIITDISKSTAEDLTPKASMKEADKKVTKGKVTPSTTAKKTPTPRSSLGAAKASATPSPRTASTRLSAKSSPLPAKVNSSTKTDAAAPKPISKPLASAAPKTSTTAARVPLSSRTKPLSATKTNETKNLTNGDAKALAKPSTGTVRKHIEVTTARSTNSSSRPTSTTGRAPLSSARGAPAAAAPKPRPNTLKPAPPKTLAATKSTTGVKPTPTAPRVPSSLLANKEVKAPLSKTFPRPRPATEKQIKETANKLTASRVTTKTTSATQVQSRTSATKKTEDKVTGTKSTTSRTITSTTSRPPIRRPTDATKTATTKVGKPKMNGVAAVVTEQIIVNNSKSEVNGISTNGDQQFVKDNSPVDNKLIVDNLAETAAN